jgi:hypothetical protein
MRRWKLKSVTRQFSKAEAEGFPVGNADKERERGNEKGVETWD